MIAGPKIALLGNFGSGNLGNDCTLEAMLLNVRRRLPSAQICIICPSPEQTALTFHLPAFCIRHASLPAIKNRLLHFLSRTFLGVPVEVYRWIMAFQRMAGCHMLVMTGTGMLGDLGIRPLGLHYDILRWTIAAKLCRCSVMFVSVGVGPIQSPLSRLFVKLSLRLAEYRSYRDGFAQTYLATIGFSATRDPVYPDLAFSLPVDGLWRAPRVPGMPTVVGVGLIEHDTKPGISKQNDATYLNYITNIAEFIRWLVQQHHTVRLLIGDVRYDQRVRRDLRIILKRGGLSYEQAGIIDEPAQSVTELVSQLAATDFVVASRFHNVLLALLLHKPTLAISFHPKVESLMSSLRMSHLCQYIDNIDVNKLTLQLAALQAGADNVRRDLARETTGYREALETQFEAILKRFDPMEPSDSVPKRNLVEPGAVLHRE